MPQTIHKAITQVLRDKGVPLTAEEIYASIIERSLYEFKAQNPLAIVIGTLRRHCDGLNFPSAREMKYFTRDSEAKWALLETPLRVKPGLFKVGSPKGKSSSVVSVPVGEDDDEPAEPTGPTHYEIQWRLLSLGSQMGLNIWCPQNDRGRAWKDNVLGTVPRMLAKLPTQFDAATNRTIENIDVLWLEGQAILAGFEVEHTSTIYSGLLRMSDLVAMQPNIDIRLYLVAPDERFGKFAREVARPTFSRSHRKPLHSLCRFLPYTRLLHRLDAAKDLISDLKPEFLNKIAEVYDPEAEFALEE
ncbi:hypothetical protein [Gemmata sp.]|uniref:hypothetical protein n=1 Tax=Gemmata sp. TaxID=1914242 RepID=UPI003F721D9C